MNSAEEELTKNKMHFHTHMYLEKSSIVAQDKFTKLPNQC